MDLQRFLEEFESCAVTPTRRHIAAYVGGLLSPLPRKSVGPLARRAGIPARTLQELLSLYRWEEDLLRQLLQRRVARGRPGRPLVGWVHHTSRPKKGDKTPGVHRRFNPAAGKAENGLVTLHLSAADGPFRALVDSELYLPDSWAGDPARCRRAGLPEPVTHRTWGKIALGMVDRARANGLDFGWFLVGPSYAAEPFFLKDLAARGYRFVAEFPARARGWLSPSPMLASDSPPRTLEALTGGREEPLYFRAEPEGMPEPPMRLLTRRQAGEARFFATNAAPEAADPVVLGLALAADAHEEAFGRERRAIGLDHFEVRSYRSLKRHLILVSAAHLFLAEAAAGARREVAL